MDSLIEEYFSLASLKSNDSRYKNMEGDFYQHRRNNNDWGDDWFIDDERLELLSMKDQNFVKFISFCLKWSDSNSPTFISEINKKLIKDSYRIKSLGPDEDWCTIYEWELIKFEKWLIQCYTWFFFRKNPQLVKYPCIILYKENWNDYWYETLYIAYFQKLPNEGQRIGMVKIYENGGEWGSNIPENFTKLEDKFCSLFQAIWIYQDLKSNPHYSSILNSLNDVTVRKDLYEKYKEDSMFVTSILRTTEAYSIVTGMKEDNKSFDVILNESPIHFNFLETKLPFRIQVIIWENGVGKTTLLGKIAEYLMNYNNFKERFSWWRPNFSKIITISYSVFDRFPQIKKEHKDLYADATDLYSYVYCGLKDVDKEYVDVKQINKRFLEALWKLKDKDKLAYWEYNIKSLLSVDFTTEKVQEFYSNSSSGQKILMTILSEILVNIEENSLLLFDEPEIYLHPNLIFKLVKTLYKILDSSNSFMIISTHSPIVLQQIPTKNISVLKRDWNNMYTILLQIESFGENFSAITREIFWNYEEKDIFYADIFNELTKVYSEDEVLKMFNNNLSLNARIYLKSLYN